MIAGKAFSAYARDLLTGHAIEERVRHLGWCGGPRLDAFFAAIDVLAQPSTYEPFGLSALEAAARGVPLVCTPVDGLVEVLGEHAFYCDDTGYPAFLDAMTRWRDADPLIQHCPSLASPGDIQVAQQTSLQKIRGNA